MNDPAPIIDAPPGAVNLTGFTMVPNAARATMRERGVSATARVLYQELCGLCYGRSATCTVPTALLVKLTRRPSRSVRRDKAELIGAGLVEVISGGRGHTTARYRLPDRSAMSRTVTSGRSQSPERSLVSPFQRLAGKTIGLPSASDEIPPERESITGREWRRAMNGDHAGARWPCGGVCSGGGRGALIRG